VVEEFPFDEFLEDDPRPDPRQQSARAELERFFDGERERVFFSRQIEILKEEKYFHWITNRALRELVELGVISKEKRALKTGGALTLLWHRSYRYYRREAASIVRLVEEYADPNIGGALGLHGETMILEGFARERFLMERRESREFQGKRWEDTNHDLDFIFSRDGVAYGVEVKNTLGYMDYEEFALKVRLCHHLGVRPVFVVRMMPKTWIHELIEAGGFALVLKYQLYPWTHRELAKRVAHVLSLPVDAPRSLEEGTMARFARWHRKNV
jgi:hypothetical protein